MNRSLTAGLSLVALVAGVTLLVGGLATLFSSALNSLAETGTGVALVALGLGCWAAGVRWVKHLQR